MQQENSEEVRGRGTVGEFLITRYSGARSGAAGHTPQSETGLPARHEGPITMRRAAEGLPLIAKKEEVSNRDHNRLEQDKPAQECPIGSCTALHHSHIRHHRRL